MKQTSENPSVFCFLPYHLCLWCSCSRRHHTWSNPSGSSGGYRMKCRTWRKTININDRIQFNNPGGVSFRRYLACPMCEASYTVGPQQYHVTLFPFWGKNGSWKTKGCKASLWHEQKWLKQLYCVLFLVFNP